MSIARLFTLVVATALASIAGLAAAQDAYPSKPITLIVPFPPGGVADIVGRPFAEALSRELKTPVIIENKPGAGGGIGMGLVAKAKPDGYTLLLALSSISILPEADKVLGRAPLYQLDQFVPIARLTADPTVLAVRADSPWKTLQDFVADARKRPGAITYGSSGNYGTMHMPMEMFAQSAGIKLTHVPFKGNADNMQAVLGEHVMAASDATGWGPHVEAGKLRLLATSGKTRSPFSPEVATLAEQGFGELTTEEWFGFYAPARTPASVISAANAAINAAIKDKSVLDSLAVVGLIAQGSTAEEMARSQRVEFERWGPLVKKVGFTAES